MERATSSGEEVNQWLNLRMWQLSTVAWAFVVGSYHISGGANSRFLRTKRVAHTRRIGTL